MLSRQVLDLVDGQDDALVPLGGVFGDRSQEVGEVALQDA